MTNKKKNLNKDIQFENFVTNPDGCIISKGLSFCIRLKNVG